MNSKDYLGKKFRDRVTGFEGICTGFHDWLTGCATVTIQPPVDKEGKVPENQGFDVIRLDPVEEKPVEMKASSKKGGPRDSPSPTHGQL